MRTLCQEMKDSNVSVATGASEQRETAAWSRHTAGLLYIYIYMSVYAPANSWIRVYRCCLQLAASTLLVGSRDQEVSFFSSEIR